MSTYIVYKILYIIIHVVYSFIQYFCDIYYYTEQGFVDFYHEISHTAKNLKYVHNEARKLNKIPTHLTILVESENHSIKDITNLILWSLAAGISFVSLYDSRGNLKRREDELRRAVEKRIKPKEHVIWHSNLYTYKNGIVGRKIHLKILSEEDGRYGVVNISKQLALSENVQNINIQNIDRCLRKYYEFPDPDLGIYFGNVFSLCGYPPWQIRVTEFLNLRSHNNVTIEMFVQVLHRFSKCEQRLGK